MAQLICDFLFHLPASPLSPFSFLILMTAFHLHDMLFLSGTAFSFAAYIIRAHTMTGKGKFHRKMCTNSPASAFQAEKSGVYPLKFACGLKKIVSCAHVQSQANAGLMLF